MFFIITTILASFIILYMSYEGVKVKRELEDVRCKIFSYLLIITVLENDLDNINRKYVRSRDENGRFVKKEGKLND